MLKQVFNWLFSPTNLRWIGISSLLLAYISVSSGAVTGSGAPFQIMNIVGSSLMIFSSLKMKPKDIPVIVFNAFWILVAVVTLSTK